MTTKGFTIVFFLFLLLSGKICAQETYSKFSFSGYKVVVVRADEFRIRVENGFDAFQEVTKDGAVKYAVKDQTGSIPKDTLYLYTNNLTSLRLHNCELEMITPLQYDSLTLIMESAFGRLNTHAQYLNLNIAAGSRLTAEGTSTILKCAVGAGSHVSARNLKVKQINLHVQGNSSLTINAEEIIEQIIDTSSFKNYFIP